jgi:hypothetical protein
MVDANDKKPWVLSFLTFCMHQFLGTWGIAFFAYWVGISLFELMASLGKPLPMRSLHWILTETPYFPVQIALGLYCGWLIARRFHHRAMRYVWMLPLMLLIYAMLELPPFTPEFSSVLAQAGHEKSVFSRYLGWGCNPRERCLDQLFVTMPFYTSVSYSVGAWLPQRTDSQRHD